MCCVCVISNGGKGITPHVGLFAYLLSTVGNSNDSKHLSVIGTTSSVPKATVVVVGVITASSRA